MKKWLLITTLLAGSCLQAQDALSSLASQLFRNCRTDRQKVTAAFQWITEHIDYNTNRYTGNKVVSTEPEEEGPLRPLNERVALNVLRRRTAFCDGFARLFSALCEKASIKSEIICGYANTGFGRSSRFGVNHYWNAVFLEGSWQLLDATWASGYINARSGEFIKSYNGNYFLADPAFFIRDHYPDDPRWTLLPDDKTPEEFRQSPFRQKDFLKYGITGYSPRKGIIDAALGDTLLLELETDRPARGWISPGTLTDSSLFNFSDRWVFLHPENEEQGITGGGRYAYRYPVTDATINWLYLVYNDDVVMRYRLHIRSQTNQLPR